MLGPYTAIVRKGKKTIDYLGNKVFKSAKAIDRFGLGEDILKDRLGALVNDERFYHLHRIDNAIFFAVVEFFRKMNAEWCNLSLVTRMISSPGEVYAGKKLDYTTDALPIEMSWFKNRKKVFLAESSQFYLELRLLIDGVDKVFAIYNSFRKERADFSHLPEFQHVEFEGKVGFEENIQIITRLLRHITRYVVDHNRADLLYFLTPSEVDALVGSFDKQNIKRITFEDALAALYESTRDRIYKDFTLEHFSSWEEIKLTELLGGHVFVTEFPLLQIPFYHNAKGGRGKKRVAENADLILSGYRETVGSGTRISDPNVLAQKAKIFNLPGEDYGPYLKMRAYKQYRSTSGFGMGWQRYVQWLLKLPFIWEATHVPRTHYLPKP